MNSVLLYTQDKKERYKMDNKTIIIVLQLIAVCFLLVAIMSGVSHETEQYSVSALILIIGALVVTVNSYP